MCQTKIVNLFSLFLKSSTKKILSNLLILIYSICAFNLIKNHLLTLNHLNLPQKPVLVEVEIVTKVINIDDILKVGEETEVNLSAVWFQCYFCHKSSLITYLSQETFSSSTFFKVIIVKL